MGGAGALPGKPGLPTWELAASVVGHVLLFGGLVLFDGFAPSERSTFQHEEVTWIAAAPPMKKAGLPQKAMRTPDPPKGTKSDTPPPPPTASDMALPSEKPKPKGAEKPEPSTEPEPTAARKRREDLVRDLSAQVGPEDRAATDANGVEGDFSMVGTPGGIQDPVIMQYVEKCRQAIYPNWTPLPSTVKAHPEYVVGVVVKIMGDGALKEPKVVQSSGDKAFDRSGILAVHKTRRFPPPPAEYADALRNGVLIQLLATDKQ